MIEAPLQAPRQLARIQVDTLVGMGISNIIALFIMITTAATLNAHGVTDIQTSSQAAEALLPYCGTFCFYGLRFGHCRHRHARIAGPRGQRRIRIRRNAALARRPCPTAGARSGLLRYDSGSDPCRSRAQFHPSRSSQGPDLERHNQRRRGRADHGDDHAYGLAQGSDGEFAITKRLAVLGWLATAVMGAAAVGMFATWGS